MGWYQSQSLHPCPQVSISYIVFHHWGLPTLLFKKEDKSHLCMRQMMSPDTPWDKETGWAAVSPGCGHSWISYEWIIRSKFSTLKWVAGKELAQGSTNWPLWLCVGRMMLLTGSRSSMPFCSQSLSIHWWNSPVYFLQKVWRGLPNTWDNIKTIPTCRAVIDTVEAEPGLDRTWPWLCCCSEIVSLSPSSTSFLPSGEWDSDPTEDFPGLAF